MKWIRSLTLIGAVAMLALTFYFWTLGESELKALPSLLHSTVHSTANASANAPANPSAKHGAPTASADSAKAGLAPDPTVVGIDEMIVNLLSGREPEKLFSLGLKLELQLFEDADSKEVNRNLGPIRHTILEATRDQDYYHLKTTAGKLYFKEILIERINRLLNVSAIRDVRFAALVFQR